MSPARPRLAGAAGGRVRRVLSHPLLAVVGLLSALGLVVSANVLSARHYARWDFSGGQRFTPAVETRRFLAELAAPADVIVLLGSADPLLVDVRHTLDALRATSSALNARYVDPDRDAAEFLALGARYDLEVGAGADGATVADAALLVVRGERRRFLRAAELVTASTDGRRALRIEQALVEALARLGEQAEAQACFVAGHGEKSPEDAGPEGLSGLERALELGNLTVRRAPLDVPDPGGALRDCRLVVVAGPARPLPDAHVDALSSAFARGASLLLLLDPVVDERGRLASLGLEPLVLPLGLRLPGGFVLERAPERRLPEGLGEAFFAEAAPHPVTARVSTEQARLDARVVLVSAQPLELAPGSAALPLLTTSPAAVVLTDLSTLDAASDASPGRRVVAAASRRPTEGREARLIVVGSSQLAENRAASEPASHGARVFLDDAVSWLVARPSPVALPPATELPPGLSLSEQSLADLLRYVLVYMPSTAALLGAFVLLRRARREQAARRPASGPGGPA